MSWTEEDEKQYIDGIKKLMKKKKSITFTADKYGVPLKLIERGTLTKEECVKRGFAPKKCPWLLKPELVDK